MDRSVDFDKIILNRSILPVKDHLVINRVINIPV